VILGPWRPKSVAGTAQNLVGSIGQDRGGIRFSSLGVVELHRPTTSRSDAREHLAVHDRIGMSLVWRTQLNGPAEVVVDSDEEAHGAHSYRHSALSERVDEAASIAQCRAVSAG